MGGNFFSTLAKKLLVGREGIYLDCENPLDEAKLEDASSLFERYRQKLIVLDEVHRRPDLFPLLRGYIDRDRGNSHLLLLGSVSLDLARQAGETLAGRVSYREMTPLLHVEVPESLYDLWLKGGFPLPFTLDDARSYQWRRDFQSTYLSRDLAHLSPRMPAETLRRFWTMLAHRQGATWNGAELGRSLEMDAKTVSRYADLLVDLLLIRRLQPWYVNVGKRLNKSPKIYVRDSGLLHGLLAISSLNGLLVHPIMGASWEGFVLENLVAAAPSASPYYYRTSAGAEIDLVLDWGPERWAIEIKRSPAPRLEKGFVVACEDIDATRRYVVHSGPDRFSMRENIEAIGLLDLCNELTMHVQ